MTDSVFDIGDWEQARPETDLVTVVETTLERLVHEGKAEKRAFESDGEITIYYRTLDSRAEKR